MQIVLNPDFEAHEGQGEFHQGRFVPCFESPSRLQHIVSALQARGAEFLEPADHGIDPILAVHDADYVDFLRTLHAEWIANGNEGDVIPYLWPVPGLRFMRHENLNAKIGSYAFSSDTPIMAGTWPAAYRGAQTALTALGHAEGGSFALTRPPGHHAHAGIYGGYCYLNNSAIAAQAAVEQGRGRVCVLDVDFHHGNGTQDIFYDRGDVLTISLHGDPRTSFPYFLGYEDEIGEDEGEGANLNLPMPAGTTFAEWRRALDRALERVTEHGTELVVVALGVDTFEGDPISSFALKTADYLEMGRLIAGLGLPTVFVMEGGYDVGPIGENVANVLDGFGRDRGR
jgi:acetoin utilization deacetylase AcuC-like enzyme